MEEETKEKVRQIADPSKKEYLVTKEFIVTKQPVFQVGIDQTAGGFRFNATIKGDTKEETKQNLATAVSMAIEQIEQMEEWFNEYTERHGKQSKHR